MKQKQLKESSRNSSVECLRILAMFFIVLSHASVHGGFSSEPSKYIFNNIFLDWCVLGNLGVDIFILISGYFLSASTFNIKSILRLLIQVWFYSLLCFFIGLLFKHTYSVRQLLEIFLPTLFTEYWFFTAYVILVLFSPYINLFINMSSKIQFSTCISVMLILWCIIPTFTGRSLYGTELPQFIMLYLIGAYFRRFPNGSIKKIILKKHITVLSFFMLFLSSAFFRIGGVIIPAFKGRELFFYSRTSLFIVGCAVGMFSISLNKKIFRNQFINLIGRSTFGMYLFHDNPTIRKILWKNWINNTLFYNSKFLPLIILINVIFVYILCLIIEYLRQKICGKITVGIVEKLYTRIDFIVHKLENIGR